jgi:hypothetical protein
MNGASTWAWYDFSDLSTMFQDSAGSTPVTAVEQPIGRINDKSGNGWHATQGTAAARPIYRVDGSGRGYAAFDGTDDSLATGTITPGAVNKAQVFAGVRKLSDAAIGMVVETSNTTDSNDGTFFLTAPRTNAANLGFRSKGTVLADAQSASAFAAPRTDVLTGIGDISGDVSRLRVNGVQAAETLTDQGTGNFLSYTMNIGSRAGSSLRFNGWMYGLIVRFSAANLDAATISNAETWMNGKTGAY